jgi:excisionase family DNA binding protein
MNNDTLDPLMTTKEAAEVLRIHPKHLLKLIQKGRAPKHFKNGRLIRFRQSDLAAYVEAGVTK